MKTHSKFFFIIKSSGLLLLVLISVINVAAQIKDVPIFKIQREPYDTNILKQITKLQTEHSLLTIEQVQSKLVRTNCSLNLSSPRHRTLKGREIWQIARGSYLRIGWYYLCKNCDKRHFNLGGGYFVTSDGICVTCQHVVKPDVKTMKQGFLIAVDEQDKVYPVVDVLAASEEKDVCFVHLKVRSKPLALNTNVAPGDTVYLYSDPLGHRGYFSNGIINRFVQINQNLTNKKKTALRINVSTDWAPGSSGAAILDQYGNAIGHVTKIESLGLGHNTTNTNQTGTCLIIHEAVSAKDVQSLITMNKSRKMCELPPKMQTH